MLHLMPSEQNSYLLYTKDFQIGDNELMYIPFYMTGMI